MGNPAFSVSSCADTLPALRFAGVQGMTTSRGRRQRPHLSRSPTPRRSGSVRAAHPDPGRRDYRTHAAYTATEFSGRVHSRPSGQGEPHPTLYHTDLFTTSKVETDAHCTLFIARRSQSFQRFGRDTACRKAACLNGNRAETAVRRQWVNCVHLNKFQ